MYSRLPTLAFWSIEAYLSLDGDALMLFNVGRFDPAKRRLVAVEAAATLKTKGYRVVFPIRRGIELRQLFFDEFDGQMSG